MKLIWIISLASVIGLAGLGCSDFLEREPKNMLYPDTYYTSQPHPQPALTGAASTLGDTNLYRNNHTTALDNNADTPYYFRSTYTYGPVIYNHTASDAGVSNLWTILYKGIGRANLLLYKLPQAEVEEKVKERIKGEALFLRGYFYFLLVQTFGSVPLVLEPTLVPENMSVPQSSPADVYAQILKDMEMAEGLVFTLNDVNHAGRVTQSAVRGILARVCLYMAGEPVNDITKYKDARYWCKKVMEDTEFKHELNPDYRQVFINLAQDKYDTKESIWEVEFWGNLSDAYGETGIIGGMNGINNDYDSEIGIARGMYAATGTFYKIYEEDDTLRRDWNIAPFTYSSTPDEKDNSKYYTVKVYHAPESYWRRYLGKYRREMETLVPKAAHNTPINYPLLRYSDVLLMYAEAENELFKMPTGAAYNAINQVRRRAFGKLMEGAVDVDKYDVRGLDYRSFQKIVREERSRELCFESLRKGDLIRWGIFVERMHEVADDIEQDMADVKEVNYKPASYCVTGFRNVSEKHILQPIPAKELSLNRLLKQNPSW